MESEFSQRSASQKPGLEDTSSRFGIGGAEDERRALTLQAWVRRQSGKSLREEHEDACEETGLNPNASELTINLPRRQMRAGQQYRANGTVGTSANGGYMVPQGFVYNLEVAMQGWDGIRQVANVIRTDSGNDMPWPTANDTGNQGAIVAEEASFGSSVIPSFNRVLFKAYKFCGRTGVLRNTAEDEREVFKKSRREPSGRFMRQAS